MAYKYFIAFILLSLLVSCEKDDVQQIPSYLHIEKIGFNSESGQGTDSVVITDAWIYCDQELIGAFELPATIPLLKKGSHTITVKPGIILNGIAATRAYNPFFKPFDIELSLVEDSVIEIFPTSGYTTAANFEWNSKGEEDFESGIISLDTLLISKTNIKRTDSVVYQGDYSGWIHMADTQSYFIAKSSTEFTLTPGKHCILEMHVKNPEVLVAVGVYSNLPGGTIVKTTYCYVNTSDYWKKMYINLTAAIDDYPNATSFHVFFETALGTDVEEANIYLDNLKLVY